MFFNFVAVKSLQMEKSALIRDDVPLNLQLGKLRRNNISWISCRTAQRVNGIEAAFDVLQ